MSHIQYEPGDLPAKGEVWKHRDNGKYYSPVDFFHHDPKTCRPFDYIIFQEYGNYGNEMEIVRVEAWHHLFEFAWGPLIECKFCGFRRMSPCAVRQTCPNLHDYRLEPDAHDEMEDADA